MTTPDPEQTAERIVHNDYDWFANNDLAWLKGRIVLALRDTARRVRELDRRSNEHLERKQSIERDLHEASQYIGRLRELFWELEAKLAALRTKADGTPNVYVQVCEMLEQCQDKLAAAERELQMW